MKFLFKLSLFAVMILNYACGTKPTENKAGIDPANFNKIVDGKQVRLETLTNKNGIEMTVTNFGARVVSLMVPDKNGEMADVVLGFDNINAYLSDTAPFLGATVGRYANRIGNANFTLNGKDYALANNDGKNHLHGGLKGFNIVVWDMEKVSANTLVLRYLSKDMEEGYPGNLSVKIIYTINKDNEFTIRYEATTDKATVVNLTHHSYFNLHGAGNGTINDHILYINADYYTITDEELIPTGEIASVAGTPFDFNMPTPIGKRINDNFQPLIRAIGYDLNYVLNQPEEKQMITAASVYEPTSGRYMEVKTDVPGMQFYTGNHLNVTDMGKKGKSYKARSAFCLETQNFPDSPNKPNFPGTVLNPGETYTHTCIYSFGIK